MKIDIPSEKNELTAVSFVNGVLICIDENTEDYFENNDSTEKSAGKKKLKKNPEDNLGNVVSFIDTDKIERCIDFIKIKERIDKILEENSWDMSDFFKNDDIVADFCKHYDYMLPDFIRMMIEQMPETFNINFLRNVIRPIITSLKKMKIEFSSGTDEKTKYRKIFAYL